MCVTVFERDEAYTGFSQMVLMLKKQKQNKTTFKLFCKREVFAKRVADGAGEKAALHRAVSQRLCRAASQRLTSPPPPPGALPLFLMFLYNIRSL